jgi:RNA polymerase sigma-70 factor (ECF subfamily)
MFPYHRNDSSVSPCNYVANAIQEVENDQRSKSVLSNWRSILSTAMCEKDAIQRARNGDPVAWGRLYELHRRRVYLLCLRHTRNVSDAEDLTQDIFIHVFHKLASFRGEAQFTSWLYTLALNFVRLHGRRQRRDARFLVSAPSEETVHFASSGPPTPTRKLALAQALSNLTTARREAVLLRDIGGLTHNELAGRIGISVIASKSRVHQAHIAMRRLLGIAY